MDERFRKELEIAVKQYHEALKAGQIKKSKDNEKFSGFFFHLSQKSLSTAGILFEVSESNDKKKYLGIEKAYDAYLWVVVSSYYSMFYMASALIAKKGINVGEESTHKNVKNAFLRLYIENGFLEKRLGIDYNECKEIAEDLMRERDKRSKYQYDVGQSALIKDAKLSLERARNFFDKTRTLV